MSAADLPLSPNQPGALHQELEQAAEWFALLRSGEATDADRGHWQAWLGAAEQHRIAWQYVERISGRFEPLQAGSNPRAAVNAFQAANTGRARRRQILLGVAAFSGTSLLGWTLWRHTPLPVMARSWTADHRSATGEVREIALADGTRVWLGTASAFDEDYRGGLRRLRLVAGEILVRTAPDPSRPFVVDTPQGRLRALGTRFTVRLDGDETLVAVYEGAVEVRTAATGAVAVIPAGRQIRFTGEALVAAGPANPAREAWTRGVLIAQDIPLAEVVAELRRYRGGHLGVAPEVAGLRVFGSYPVSDPDRTLAMLESVMPIRVRHTLPWWVSIEPKGSVATDR